MKYSENTRKNGDGYKHSYPQVWTINIIIIFQCVIALLGGSLSDIYYPLLRIFYSSLISVLSMYLAEL